MKKAILTKTDIAQLSLAQIESVTVPKLKEWIIEILEIKGKSKLAKPELVKIIYSETNDERQAIKKANQAHDEKLSQEKSLHEKLVYDTLKNSSYELLQPEWILNQLKRHDGEIVGKTIYQTFSLHQTSDSVNGNIGSLLKETLELMLSRHGLSLEDKTAIMLGFNESAKPSRIARKRLDNAKVDSYVLQAEKEFTQPSLIVEWAKNSLNHKSHVYKSLALAILSGRRMVELYYSGDFTLANNGMIHISGIAKKADNDINYCDFIPLCDAELWLESWKSLSKSDNEKHVNQTVSRTISKCYPVSLKDLGIEKFKDSRDFYAGVCVGIFKELGYNIPEHFTMKLMGHSTGEATKHYRKYNVTNLPSDLVEKFKFYKG